MLQAVPPQHHQPQLRVVVDIMVETQLLPARQVPLFVSLFHLLSTLCISGDCSHTNILAVHGQPHVTMTTHAVLPTCSRHRANARSVMHPLCEMAAGSFHCQGQHALPTAENFRATAQQTVHCICMPTP